MPAMRGSPATQATLSSILHASIREMPPGGA